MNRATVLKNLHARNIISDGQYQMIGAFLSERPFSVFNELRMILYAGILLLTSGSGVIIYQHIDTIGHQIIIALIALISAACFYHAFKHRLPFSWTKLETTNKLAAYSLFLGCVTFLTLEGYLQYQYQLFGTRYGLAIAIPTLVFFYCAYRLDHTGVLSMAVTGLASWLGLTIAPLSVLSANNFSDPSLLTTAIILGLGLVVFSKVSEKWNLKKHFSFTFLFLGGNLATIAALSGLFDDGFPVLYILIGTGLSAYFVAQARSSQSAIFLLMGVVYGYIIVTYTLFKVLPETLIGLLSIWYFLFSSVGVLLFLLNFKKILKTKK